MIVTGDPAATITEPTGILKAAAISDSSDLTIKKINKKTLREIALNYGGANNVEGGSVLLLNQKDLIAFGNVRGTAMIGGNVVTENGFICVKNRARA